MSEAILKEMSLFLEYFVFIEKIRFISRVVGINPKFPIGAEIGGQDENVVLLVYELAQGREFRQEGYSGRGTVCLEGNSENFNKVYEYMVLDGRNGQLVLEDNHEKKKFSLLGEMFEFGLLRYTITNIKINLGEFPELISKNDTEIKKANMEWESGAESVLTIAKL